MRISVLIFALLSSICTSMAANAFNGSKEKEDSIPLFNSVAVSVDLLGAGLMLMSDYGQYEAALRINLKDRYFPVFEIGYGAGKHEYDAVTGLQSEAKAPYFRIGADYNMRKNKHDGYRLYGGFRYAFTSYDFNLSHQGLADPVYGGTAPINITGERVNFHWLEGVFGVDVPLIKPVRLGWSVRYRRRITSTDLPYGTTTWYVPGFGTDEKNKWSGTFNLIFEL